MKPLQAFRAAWPRERGAASVSAYSAANMAHRHRESFERNSCPPNRCTDSPKPIRRALVVNKMTTFEYMTMFDDLDVDEVIHTMPAVHDAHVEHRENLDILLEILSKHNVFYQVLNLHNQQFVSPADSPNSIPRDLDKMNFDTIISAGGDGTYLEAAQLVDGLRSPLTVRGAESLGASERATGNLNQRPVLSLLRGSGTPINVPTRESSKENLNPIADNPSRSNRRDVWLFGINTNPSKSFGKLCMMPARRITGPSAGDGESQPERNGNAAASESISLAARRLVNLDFAPLCRHRIRVSISGPDEDNSFSPSNSNGSSPPPKQALAVNDVMVAKLESAATLHAEVKINNGAWQRMKNSGIITCTGTGSTAWVYNICKIQKDTVRRIVEEFVALTGLKDQTFDELDFGHLTDNINDGLIFPPYSDLMQYTLREPITNRVFRLNQPARGLCKMLQIRMLSSDSGVFVDGAQLVKLDRGSVVKLMIHPEDRLLTAR